MWIFKSQNFKWLMDCPLKHKAVINKGPEISLYVWQCNAIIKSLKCITGFVNCLLKKDQFEKKTLSSHLSHDSILIFIALPLLCVITIGPVPTTGQFKTSNRR